MIDGTCVNSKVQEGHLSLANKNFGCSITEACASDIRPAARSGTWWGPCPDFLHLHGCQHRLPPHHRVRWRRPRSIEAEGLGWTLTPVMESLTDQGSATRTVLLGISLVAVYEKIIRRRQAVVSTGLE